MLVVILFFKLVYFAYITPYLYGLYNGLSPVLPSNLFAALTPPILSANFSGSGSKDIKMEPIAKWDSKAKSLRVFLINYFTHFEF